MVYFVRVTVLFWHFYPQICVLYCVLCFTVAVCQPLNKHDDDDDDDDDSLSDKPRMFAQNLANSNRHTNLDVAYKIRSGTRYAVTSLGPRHTTRHGGRQFRRTK